MKTITTILDRLANALRMRRPASEHDAGGSLTPLAEVELVVPKMVCEGCAESVGAALSAVPGVRKVTAKPSQKRVTVQYEPARVEQSDLKAALESKGFIARDAG